MTPNQNQFQRAGETEAIILIKATPQVSTKHGETVCCAGVDIEGNWLRMFPIAFRNLADTGKFGRWDRVKFKWRKPSEDLRIESRHVNQDTLEIVGRIKKQERPIFFEKMIVGSLDEEHRQKRSLALIRPKILNFKFERKTEDEIGKESQKFAELRRQSDLFCEGKIIPYNVCPYSFKYKYETDDGVREGTCQDWEIGATYYRFHREYGEEKALNEMADIYGNRYPEEGMCLAMGTHSRWPDKWLINGVIKLDQPKQMGLF
ncbi:MAG: hypothetical protein JKY96_01520 [Phycisphaerales bacterium]|nr:hypothetical protein [Phycisphaerales bacterium]